MKRCAKFPNKSLLQFLHPSVRSRVLSTNNEPGQFLFDILAPNPEVSCRGDLLCSMLYVTTLELNHNIADISLRNYPISCDYTFDQTTIDMSYDELSSSGI